MKKTVIYELRAAYRDDMRVQAYCFGGGEKACAIVGGMRGNEIQQIYTCSQLVARLRELEKRGMLASDKSVMVVPCINPYSVNVERRFWPTDNTDINRMFPGYNLGETTQRIAAGVFEALMGYQYGIHITSNYIPGSLITHARIMNTGWDYIDEAKKFGFEYVSIREPRPYDTTTLNYNWQIWETKTVSILLGESDVINKEASEEAVSAILRFLKAQHVVHPDYVVEPVRESKLIYEKEQVPVKASVAGLFDPVVNVRQLVAKGQLLARILDAGDGSVRQEVRAPVDGKVFFLQISPRAYANAAVAKLLRE